MLASLLLKEFLPVQYTSTTAVATMDLRVPLEKKRYGQAGVQTTAPSVQALKKARQALEHNDRETSRCNDQIIAATLGITDDEVLEAQPIAVQMQLAAMAQEPAGSPEYDESGAVDASKVPANVCSVRGCPFNGLVFGSSQDLLDHASAEHPKNKWRKERCVLFQVRQCFKCEKIFKNDGEMCEHLAGVDAAETIPKIGPSP
jgi:hypothetical protein